MAKKITKWEPEDFELEMTTHWSFPKRGDWATHDAKWRGNWSPYTHMCFRMDKRTLLFENIVIKTLV